MSSTEATTILDAHGCAYRWHRDQLQAADIYTVRRGGIVRTGRHWHTINLRESTRVLYFWLGY